MLLTPVLSRAPLDAALDVQRLQALGLEHIRRLARRLWTDHNVHDPGITSLELFSYALTDLAYRAGFPIEDLLATGTDDAAGMARQFFTARRILPNRSLTEADYRKLVIDLPGVKNAWIEAVPFTLYADTVRRELRRTDPGTPGVRKVTVRGRYRVLVEFMDDVTTQVRRNRIRAEVLALLAANRNLCEEFVEVVGIPHRDIALCAELELESAADPNAIAAAVQFRIQRYLAPPVPNYTLAEMLARRHPDGTPYTLPEIFAGPSLAHGFIDDAELAAAGLRSEIRLSDIISLVMDIPGVRAVRDIVVNALDAGGNPLPAADKWRLAVPGGTQPRLSLTTSRLVCYKQQMPLPLDPAKVDAARTALEGEERRKLETLPQEDVPLAVGRNRRVAEHHSFQHHFPVIYGLSAQGLPAGTGPLRQAQALQFAAYLLFFDQVLANACAQLANLRELFSREPATRRTYFAQAVRSVPAWTRLYDPETADDERLADLFEDEAAAIRRRERFVDHLLARFAEDFSDYAAVMRSAFGASLALTQASKYDFLRDLPELGGERSLAYNDRLRDPADLWNSLNVSGLERRLARLLGIANWSRRNLGEVSYDLYAEIDATPGDEFRFRVVHPLDGKILLSSSTRYTTKEAARTEMIRAIELAQQADGYQRRQTSDGRHYFNIVDPGGEVVARRIEYFLSESAMETAIDALIRHLNEHYSGEGMYLVENLLLLPQQVSDPLLPICVDPTCSDCPDDDPYSYRLHVVLPAYAGRFRNMDFRRFVEETIRLETPAHILPKICWVDAADMALFESAYRDWIGLRAGADTGQRLARLNAFIAALYSVRNVYPGQKLFECSSDAAKPSFILGRSALGSQGQE